MISSIDEGAGGDVEAIEADLLIPILNSIQVTPEPWLVSLPIVGKWISSHINNLSASRGWTKESIYKGDQPVEVTCASSEAGVNIVLFVEGWEYANLKTKIKGEK